MLLLPHVLVPYRTQQLKQAAWNLMKTFASLSSLWPTNPSGDSLTVKMGQWSFKKGKQNAFYVLWKRKPTDFHLTWRPKKLIWEKAGKASTHPHGKTLERTKKLNCLCREKDLAEPRHGETKQKRIDWHTSFDACPNQSVYQSIHIG